MTHFETCPRCHRSWDTNYRLACPRCQDKFVHMSYDLYECIGCRAKYDAVSECFVLQDVLEDYDTLSFFKNRCEYGTLDDYAHEKELSLPLLPYDITPEKLKLYLFYS